MIHCVDRNCKKGSKMRRAYVTYITALLLFGLNGIVAGRIAMSSYEIVLLRTGIGSMLLVVLFAIGKGRLTFYKRRGDFLFLCLSGMAMGASWMFLYEAYRQIGVSIASLCYYCGPVLVVAASPMIFREKMTAQKVFGLLAVFCGIFLVNGKLLLAGGSRIGFLCGFLSAVMYAFMVVFNKKAEQIVGLENAMLQLVISFITVAVYTGIRYGYDFAIPESSIPWILVLGLFNTGLGCYFYFSSIGKLPVQTVAVCGYLEPLSAVLFSVVLLKETMTVIQVFGVVLILGGAGLSEIRAKRS